MHFKKNKHNLLALIFTGVLFSRNAVNSMELTDLKPGQITQINVLEQNPGGECGYHAIFNGIFIAKSLRNNSFISVLNQKPNFFDRLKQIWKNKIIKNRISTLAKYYITDVLLKNLILGTEICHTCPENTDGNYYKLNLSNKWIKLNNRSNNAYILQGQKAICGIVVNVAEELVKNSTVDTYGINRFNYTKDVIFKAVKEEIKRRAETDNNLIYEQLYKQFSNISSWQIAQFKSTFQCCNFNFSINMQTVNDNIVADSINEYVINWQDGSIKGNDSQAINIGEWLSSSEIDSVIKELSKLTPPSNSSLDPNIKIFCLEGEVKDLFNLEDNLKQVACNFKDNKYEGTAIFVIYYERHWLTCVVDKKKNELPKFIFADSLNINRTKTSKAFELISALSNFNYREDKFLPLDILVENQHLNTFQVLIKRLNEKNIKGLWLHGPEKNGKSNLVYTLSKLANCKVNYIDFADLILELKQNKPANVDEIIKYYRKSIKDIFNNLSEKDSSNLEILFVHHFDKAVLNFDKDIFNIFEENLRIYKKNHNVFLILSSITDPKDMIELYTLKDLVNAFKLELPTTERRAKIIDYYAQRILYRKILNKASGKTFCISNDLISNVFKATLARETRGLSYQDIKDIFVNAALAVKDDIPNSHIALSLTDNKYLDVCCSPIFGKLYNFMSNCYIGTLNEYEQYLYNYCQRQKLDNRQNREVNKLIINSHKEKSTEPDFFEQLWKRSKKGFIDGAESAIKTKTEKGLGKVADAVSDDPIIRFNKIRLKLAELKKDK